MPKKSQGSSLVSKPSRTPQKPQVNAPLKILIQRVIHTSIIDCKNVNEWSSKWMSQLTKSESSVDGVSGRLFGRFPVPSFQWFAIISLIQSFVLHTNICFRLFLPRKVNIVFFIFCFASSNIWSRSHLRIRTEIDTRVYASSVPILILKN